MKPASFLLKRNLHNVLLYDRTAGLIEADDQGVVFSVVSCANSVPQVHFFTVKLRSNNGNDVVAGRQAAQKRRITPLAALVPVFPGMMLLESSVWMNL